jgi:hypothetical protein
VAFSAEGYLKNEGWKMGDNAHSLKLDILPEQIRQPLTLFAERLCAGLGDNLQSITVVGSSLTRDYRAGRSDINTVLVLDTFSLDCLNTIAGMARPMSKKKVSVPLLMTPAYIERSLDVFGVEFLDFQLTHRTIWGGDPFVQLRFEKRNVRLQCERELKATLIRLRQGYVAAAAKKRLLRDIIIAAAKGLTPLLRAMLWLKDIDRPAEAEPTFNRAAAAFSVRMESLITAGNWRQGKIRPQEAEVKDTFASVYTAVEQLAATVDKLEV